PAPPSLHRRKTSRRSRPCETTTAHQGTPPWRPDTVSSWAWSTGALPHGQSHASKGARPAGGAGEMLRRPRFFRLRPAAKHAELARETLRPTTAGQAAPV